VASEEYFAIFFSLRATVTPFTYLPFCLSGTQIRIYCREPGPPQCREDAHPVRLRAARNPHFRSVDYVIVAVANCIRLDRGNVWPHTNWCWLLISSYREARSLVSRVKSYPAIGAPFYRIFGIRRRALHASRSSD
jgi:hypothetical protein